MQPKLVLQLRWVRRLPRELEILILEYRVQLLRLLVVLADCNWLLVWELAQWRRRLL